MLLSIKQHYKPLILCYTPTIIFFGFIRSFLDQSSVTAIALILFMSITTYCVVVEKLTKYHQWTMYSLNVVTLLQFYYCISSICDYIFLFFALCVNYAIYYSLTNKFK
jgi:uncharacterized membrane protein (DUF106 family)